MKQHSTIHTTNGTAVTRRQPLASGEVAAIVRRAFGDGAALERAEEISTGTVNTTWRLTLAGQPPLILRVGPAAAVAESGPTWLPADTLQREHALTPWFAPVAPLLPKTVAADFTHQITDRDWVVQPVVPGQPWSELASSLTAEQVASLWRQLGALTRRIHAVEGKAFGPLPPGVSFPAWSALLAHDADGILIDFARFGLPTAPARRLRAAVAANAATLDAARPPLLIHSDLDPRHVFVTIDARGEPVISGLIDHEFGRFADPLSESLLLWLALEPSAGTIPFFAGYGSIPDDEVTRWRMRLYQAIVLGWTAGDVSHQGQETTSTLNAFERAVGMLEARS